MAPVEIQPINDQIVLERLDPLSVSPGGILIPLGAQAQQQEGLVIAVGPGKFVGFAGFKEGELIITQSVDAPLLQPITVKPGDRVLFSKYAGADVELRGKKYTILTEAAIYAVLHEQQQDQEAVA